MVLLCDIQRQSNNAYVKEKSPQEAGLLPKQSCANLGLALPEQVFLYSVCMDCK